MKRAIAATTAYFLALFTLGFVLGTIRVLYLAPRVGELSATLLELPLMLAAAFFVCRWLLAYWQVPIAMATRLGMALLFLVLLLGFETLLGATLFGRTLAQQGAAMGTHPGLAGLAAQVIVALMPMVVGRNGNR